MLKCHHLKGNQLWEYDPVVSLLMSHFNVTSQLGFLREPTEQHIPGWNHCLTDKTGNKVRIMFPLLLIHGIVTQWASVLI